MNLPAGRMARFGIATSDSQRFRLPLYLVPQVEWPDSGLRPNWRHRNVARGLNPQVEWPDSGLRLVRSLRLLSVAMTRRSNGQIRDCDQSDVIVVPKQLIETRRSNGQIRDCDLKPITWKRPQLAPADRMARFGIATRLNLSLGLQREPAGRMARFGIATDEHLPSWENLLYPQIEWPDSGLRLHRDDGVLDDDLFPADRMARFGIATSSWENLLVQRLSPQIEWPDSGLRLPPSLAVEKRVH